MLCIFVFWGGSWVPCFIYSTLWVSLCVLPSLSAIYFGLVFMCGGWCVCVRWREWGYLLPRTGRSSTSPGRRLSPSPPILLPALPTFYPSLLPPSSYRSLLPFLPNCAPACSCTTCMGIILATPTGHIHAGGGDGVSESFVPSMTPSTSARPPRVPEARDGNLRGAGVGHGDQDRSQYAAAMRALQINDNCARETVDRLPSHQPRGFSPPSLPPFSFLFFSPCFLSFFLFPSLLPSHDYEKEEGEGGVKKEAEVT